MQNVDKYFIGETGMMKKKVTKNKELCPFQRPREVKSKNGFKETQQRWDINNNPYWKYKEKMFLSGLHP